MRMTVKKYCIGSTPFVQQQQADRQTGSSKVCDTRVHETVKIYHMYIIICGHKVWSVSTLWKQQQWLHTTVKHPQRINTFRLHYWPELTDSNIKFEYNLWKISPVIENISGRRRFDPAMEWCEQICILRHLIFIQYIYKRSLNVHVPCSTSFAWHSAILLTHTQSHNHSHTHTKLTLSFWKCTEYILKMSNHMCDWNRIPPILYLFIVYPLLLRSLPRSHRVSLSHSFFC